MSGKIGPGETPKTEKKEGFVEKHKSKIIAGGIGATVGAVALPLALPALGFTATGVAAGSGKNSWLFLCRLLLLVEKKARVSGTESFEFRLENFIGSFGRHFWPKCDFRAIF